MWSSVSRPRVGQRHRVQHLIQKLQSAVQVDFHPAGGVFNALTWVVGPPAFHKAEPQDAEPPQVIHADPCCCRQTDCRCDSSNTAWTRDVSCHSGCLSRCCSLSRCCLLLHLPVTLPQVKHLDVGPGVDLVNGVAWCSTRLSIEVVTLNKYSMITHTAHPHITLTTTLQLDAFTNVQPGSLTGISAVDIAQLA